MIRELRDVSLLVVRCEAALEMPETIRVRDDLVRRYAATAVRPPRVETDIDIDADVDFERGEGSLLLAVDDDDLPLYF